MEFGKIIEIVAIVIALLVAIIGHEIMHGYVAYKLGDDTAKNEGRLSINPIVHIDPIGTIVVPIMLLLAGSPFMFGWAKPVPINIHTVINRGGFNGAILVALAGVLYNLLVAIFASTLLDVFDDTTLSGAIALIVLQYLIVYNIVLAVFNLWPIPPLDGSKALLYLFLKYKAYSLANFIQKMESYGMIILIIVLVTPLKDIFFTPALKLMQILL